MSLQVEVVCMRLDDGSVVLERLHIAGCVCFSDPAPLELDSPILRSPAADREKDNMNEAEFVSHVAAESATTRAVAERMVVALFCAIADSLARNEPAAIAECRRFAPFEDAPRVSPEMLHTSSPGP